MQARVTIVELARQLEVHPSTISLGLRGSHHVSRPLQNRIRTLAQQMGYAPNHMARALRRRSTKTLGVIFPYATAPYYATLLDSLYAETLARGHHLEVCFHQWSAREERVMLNTLLERQVEGLILLPATAATFATLEELAPALKDMPVAILGCFGPTQLPAYVRGCVFTDIYAGSEELGRFLLEMGHRHIALLSPNPRLAESGNLFETRRDREKGLRAALADQPAARLEAIYLDEDETPDESTGTTRPHGAAVDKSFQLARQVADRFLALSPRPTVAVTTNEVGAYVLIECLQARGLQVPADVSVACYDGTFLSEFGPMSLTCVKQPLREIADNLVELVLTARADGPPPEPVVHLLPPTLLQRRSVARIAPGSP